MGRERERETVIQRVYMDSSATNGTRNGIAAMVPTTGNPASLAIIYSEERV